MIHRSKQRHGVGSAFGRRAPALLVSLSLLSTAARALEHVELRNGFSYDCARREVLADGQIRLFLIAGEPTGPDAGAVAANFIDLPADRILSVETVADPPAVVAAILAPRVNAAGAALEVQPLLALAGTAHNIDAELLASIVRAESGGRALAVSRTGARGLMQLMPDTARAMNVTDSFAPADNINGGTAYLDRLLMRYHDNLALALAAYNAGPAAVDHFHGVPPFRETRQYVVRVMTEFKRRKAALRKTASPSAKTTAAALALAVR